MALSERPARTDPSTGLTRPGQREDQSPAGAYRAPSAGVSAPTPRLGQGSRDAGRPLMAAGPGMSQGGGPMVPTDLNVVAVPRGTRETGMTGPLMRSGNSPSSFPVNPTASAEQSRDTTIGGVLETVRRNGGTPFDGR